MAAFDQAGKAAADELVGEFHRDLEPKIDALLAELAKWRELLDRKQIIVRFEDRPQP